MKAVQSECTKESELTSILAIISKSYLPYNFNMAEMNICSLCGLQYQQHLMVQFDIPTYHPQVDSVKIINRRTCKQCCLIIANIQSFADQNHLRFCNHAFKSHLFDFYFVDHAPQPRKSIQLLYETVSQSFQRRGSFTENIVIQAKRMSMTERTNTEDVSDEQIHPYMHLLIEEILQKNYLTLAHFPKTLQLLVYVSSMTPMKDNKSPQSFVLAEQRHEKIKNIVLYLSEQIHLSVSQLPYVLFLINFLLCFMNPQKTVSVVIQLSHILIAYPQLLSWKSLLFDNERATHQTPLSPATIDMRTLLVQIDKLWVKIQAVIDLGRRGENVLREGLIRLSKLELNCESKEYKKKVSQSLKSLMSKKEDLELLDEQHLHLLYLIKLERNSFSLILKEAMEEEQLNRQEMIKMSHKFKLEKDEFIEKIIKLNNKIEALEQTIKELEERTKGNEIQKQQQESIVEKIQQTKLQPKMQEIGNQSLDIELNSIVTITDLFNFNQKHYHLKKSQEEQSIPTDLTQRIIIEIQKMQELIQKNASRVKFIEDEKSRLLGIISRKEERLLSVILEKDTVIQRYQQALWTMENGLEVTEGPLVNRIKYIMHIFATRQKRYDQEVMDVMQEVVVKKSKEKDCQIY